MYSTYEFVLGWGSKKRMDAAPCMASLPVIGLTTSYPLPMTCGPTPRYLPPSFFVVLLREPGSPITPLSALFLLHYSLVNLYLYALSHLTRTTIQTFISQFPACLERIKISHFWTFTNVCGYSRCKCRLSELMAENFLQPHHPHSPSRTFTNVLG